MLVKYATLWLFTLPLSLCNLLEQYPFFFLPFFWRSTGAPAYKICYFSVFLHPIMRRFWESNMLQRGDNAREICYFVVVHASPFPCNLLGQYPYTNIIIYLYLYLFSSFFWRSTDV